MNAPPALALLSRSLPECAADAVTLVAVVRNEAVRLPYFLGYYRRLGVGRFLFIDNGSSDGTAELLLAAPDVAVFRSEESYAQNRHGRAWVKLLLDRHCRERWCLLADADELLIWPGCEGEELGALIRRMAAAGAAALFTVMIDMYSDRPFGRVGYRAGDDPLERCPFFDREPYDLYSAERFPFRLIRGGVRQRLFAAVPALDTPFPIISKLPLLCWREGQDFVLSAHLLAEPVALAAMRGGLLHFKMLDDLPEKCRIEIARGQYFDGAREYRALAAALDERRGQALYDPARSARYGGSRDLLERGILSAAGPFD